MTTGAAIADVAVGVTSTCTTSICVHPETPAERRRLARMAKAGTCARPLRSLYAPAAEWARMDEVERARHAATALAKLHPNWVFCSFTAAALYGLEIGRDRAWPLHVQSPHGGNSRDDGTLVHERPACETPAKLGPALVTPPAETVVDCLLELPFPRALAVADSALRMLRLTRDELLAELRLRQEGRPRRVAENAVRYANPLAENGGESVARAVMIEQGFMLPELQVEMCDPLDPNVHYYVDFLWRLASGDVMGELDGRDKYVLPEMTGERDTLDVMIDERHRESRLTVPGAKVLRFTFRDVMDVKRFVRLLELYGIPRGPARAMDE